MVDVKSGILKVGLLAIEAEGALTDPYRKSRAVKQMFYVCPKKSYIDARL